MNSMIRCVALASSVCLLAGLAPAQFGDIAKMGGLGGLGGHHGKKDDKQDGMTVSVKLPPYFGPKKRIGVQDMEIKITSTTSDSATSSGGVTTTTTIDVPPPSDFGQGLTEMLTTSLVATKRFIVLERTDKGLADMQREQTLQGVNDETRAQANKLMGAQLLIRGAVTEFTYTKSKQDVGGDIFRGIGVSTSKAQAAVVIDVKLYDATTGEIIDSKKVEGRVSTSGTALSVDRDNMKFGGQEFQQSPLGQATRQAIEKAVLYICQSMDTKPWEGRIATVVDEGKGPQLYINAGGRAGIKVGDEFDVFHPGSDVVDPDTNKVISHTKGVQVGRCKVVSVDDDVAIATPIEGTGFAAKDYVRFSTPPPAADAMPAKP